MRKIKDWIMKPAKPYQFWLPQSGLSGGLIILAFSLVIMLIIELVK